MKKTNTITVMLTVLLASAAIIGGAYAFKNLTPDSRGPEKTVREFYKEWTDYQGNPMVAQVHRGSIYTSKEFADKVDAIRDSFEFGGYDPVLCAQDIPERIDFINTVENEGTATVTIKEVFGGNEKIIEVQLAKTGEDWKITDIICNTPKEAGLSQSIQNLVGDYIRENISDLSPEKEVLGGTFYVTSINFTGENTADVAYEDGHIALTAKVKFAVSENDVEIISFDVMDEYGTANFKKTGNLTKKDNAWTLVYEEPGKPALTAVLEFGKNSKCLDEYQDKACAPVYWKVGDRAQVIGFKEGEKVLVLSFSLVGEAVKTIIGEGVIRNFSECVDAGNEAMYPDCIGCKAYCDAPDGSRFEE